MDLEKIEFLPDDFEFVGDKQDITKDVVAPSLPAWKDSLNRFKKNKGAVIGLVCILIIGLICILVIAVFAIFAPMLSSYEFDAINTKIASISPCAEHFFGTDTYGRDLFVRVWTGTRYSLFIAVVAIFIGRIARLWHTTLLSKWKPIFEYIPLESQIEKFQDDYYSVIAKCHVLGESTLFIEFMLSQIDKILDDISKQVNEDIEQIDPNIKKLLDVMEDDVSYSSNELMQKLNLKAKEGFRRNYLRPAIDQNLIYMTIPDKPKSKNQRYIKV